MNIDRDKIRAEALAAAEVKIAHEERKAATMEAIAARCAGMNISEPMIFDSCGKTFLSFRKIAPDALLALLEIFPPLEMEYRRDPSRRESSFVLATVPPKEGQEQTAIDPFTITADNYGHGAQFKAKWATVGLEIWAELSAHPLRYSANVKYYGNSDKIASVENCNVSGQLSSVRTLRYAAHARDAFNTIMLYGFDGDMQRMVEQWAEKLTAEGRATLAAYENAKACANLETVTPESIAAQFPAMHDYAANYAREKLRAGTMEQYLALHTPQAIAEHDLAAKHWHYFAREHGIEVSEYRNYFDYFAWACNFLKRAGLYRVPITDEMRATVTGSFPEGATEYKYGERWL